MRGAKITVAAAYLLALAGLASAATIELWMPVPTAPWTEGKGEK